MEAAVKAYRNTTQQVSRDKLVVDHLSLVRHVLSRILATLPDGVDRENLEAAGTLGLVEAASQFDPTREVKFSTFAWKRIYGAVIDELRRNCPLPQSMLERWARVREILERTGGLAESADIAKELGLTESDVENCFAAVRLTQPETFKEGSVLVEQPFDFDDREEQMELIVKGLQRLDERDRAILVMYYRDEMYLREIGEVLDLSESRICRLLTAAEAKLKATVLSSQSNR